MGAIQIWESASSAKMGIESLLIGRGLESQIGSAELADAICKNKSEALVEQLNQYAAQFPESREVIVEALDLASKCECAKVIRSAKRSVSEILALSMVEAF
ncbi:MAG: hypothetical protein KGH71_04960, partial [Candidatus Micrarchaeota archaeon]|nr:hypothetical protein [Candidatus Micrarchaeota archaeon]